MDHSSCCCVLDASTYVGFWILMKLLSRGYSVHAAIRTNEESEIEEKIRDMEATEERLVVYDVDVLDYQSILVSIKTCNVVFCCLDSPEGYDEKEVELEVRGAINIVEACGRTESIEKIVFSSSLTASIWRENIGTQKDVDEKCWSDQDFCRNKKAKSVEVDGDDSDGFETASERGVSDEEGEGSDRQNDAVKSQEEAKHSDKPEKKEDQIEQVREGDSITEEDGSNKEKVMEEANEAKVEGNKRSG